MPSPNTYVDGTPGFGTPTVTINATTYVVETFNIQRPTKDAKSYTATGTPSQNRRVVDWATGTMTIQATSGTAGKPQFGATFSLTVDDNFGSETWVISEVPFESSNDAGTLRKINVTFEKVITSITTT